MSTAGFCLLGDIETAGGIRPPPIEFDILGLIPTTLRQEIGLTRFDPAVPVVEGFQAVSISVPLLGRIDNATQKFKVAPASDSVNGALKCDNLPIARRHVFNVTSDDSDFNVRLTLPGIPISTPIGPFVLCSLSGMKVTIPPSSGSPSSVTRPTTGAT